MSNVQLPGSRLFYSQILMYYCTQNNDVSLAKEFQNNLSKEHQNHGVIDQGKYRKISSKRKKTDREYYFQDNDDVAQKDVKIYCDTNQFPTLPFCGQHPKPHGVRGLSQHTNLRFDPKLGHGICAICLIPCACDAFTLMLDQPWISGIPLKKAHYQHVIGCTYWPFLGTYN